MERATHIIILTLISCFEIWMCYQILYRTVLEKRYLQTWQKILIWGNILGMGIVLGVNRNIFLIKCYIVALHFLYNSSSSDFKCEEMASYCRNCRNLLSVCSIIRPFLCFLRNSDWK